MLLEIVSLKNIYFLVYRVTVDSYSLVIYTVSETSVNSLSTCFVFFLPLHIVLVTENSDSLTFFFQFYMLYFFFSSCMIIVAGTLRRIFECWEQTSFFSQVYWHITLERYVIYNNDWHIMLCKLNPVDLIYLYFAKWLPP